MTPSMFTDPAVDVAVNEPPLMPPVVRSPADRMAIGALPASSTLPAATRSVPPVAVRLIAPLLVATDSFTLRLRAAVSATAPPATPPRPSICAFTLTSRPASTVSPLPLWPFRID